MDYLISLELNSTLCVSADTVDQFLDMFLVLDVEFIWRGSRYLWKSCSFLLWMFAYKNGGVSSYRCFPGVLSGICFV